MRDFFAPDGPAASFLGRVADLVILNLITLVCCVPVVTAGASLTAMNYVCLKMIRGEDAHYIRKFFHSFRQNFRQATLSWLLFLAIFAVTATDVYLIRHNRNYFPGVLSYMILAAAFLVFLIMLYVFPLLSHFENTVGGTLRNAVILAVSNLPKTIFMAVLFILPPVILFSVRALLPLVFLFGLSVPGYFSALLYDPIFKKLEPEERGEDRE